MTCAKRRSWIRRNLSRVCNTANLARDAHPVLFAALDMLVVFVVLYLALILAKETR